MSDYQFHEDILDLGCPDGFSLHYIDTKVNSISEPKCLLSQTQSVSQIKELFLVCGSLGGRLMVPTSLLAIRQALTALELNSSFVGITEGETEGLWVNLNDGSAVSSFGNDSSGSLDFGDWPENTAENRTYICETQPNMNRGNSALVVALVNLLAGEGLEHLFIVKNYSLVRFYLSMVKYFLNR